jgi:hypothetical protein
MNTKTRQMILALKRARMEMSYTTAILRVFLHDPNVQGVLQNLTFAIDDADKLLAKLEPLTREQKTNERKRISKAATPPAP